MSKMEWNEETTKHFEEHIKPMLPATGEEILAACENMSDVPDEDSEVVKSRLIPSKMYESMDEIMVDLNMEPEEEEEE